jgi:predicted AlkP superfamily phosphohydrolase/phosphomutase
MPIFNFKKKKRVCVIGLDGVPYGMIAELARRGVMPAMAGLIESGHLHKMRASLPEISAVSWTNFMTGRNSGTHGIFGFTDFKPGSYGLRFPNFLDVAAPVLWDTLGGRGKKSVVINQPSTYPARPMNGVLISGFVALDLAKAVYPASRRAAIERMGYLVDIDIPASRGNPEVLWRELHATLDGQEKALDSLWIETWDYFEFIITGTDRLHHFLWQAYEDAAHPDHGKFLDYYRRVDRIIGRLAAGFRKLTGSEQGLYLLSDHGFTGIIREVYLNAWLEQAGYMAFDKAEPKGLEDISGASRAFALDPNRIYLNLTGKFPAGSVDPAGRKALCEEIAAGLLKLEWEGRRVVRKVFPSEDVYSGPLAARGPDLLVVGEPGFDMKGSVKKKEVFGRSDLQGMHTWDDAFFWADTDKGRDLAIEDLAPIILGNYP